MRHRFRLLDREAALVALGGIYLLLLIRLLKLSFLSDSWLSLAGGRTIAANGLPHTNSWTVIGSGRPWANQQWLAQLCLYEIDRIGGVALLGLTELALVGVGITFLLVGARRRGASTRAVCLIGLLSLPIAIGNNEIRAQLFSFALFPAVLYLLDLRRLTGRRIVAVVVLLMLWANLHGVVLLGAVSALLAAVELYWRERQRKQALLLALGAALAPFASPYALEIPGYYHSLIFNRTLQGMISEWQPPTFAHWPLLFVLLALAAFLIGRNPKDLRPSEIAVLALCALAALEAIRSIVWFAYSAILYLPLLLPALSLKGHWLTEKRGRLLRRSGMAASLLLVVALGALELSELPGAVAGQRPSRSFAYLASAKGHVLASDELADELIWAEPQWQGRVGFDGHFENYSAGQLGRIARWELVVGPGWKQLENGYRYLLVSRVAVKKTLDQALLAQPGLRLVAEDQSAYLFERSQVAKTKTAAGS